LAAPLATGTAHAAGVKSAAAAAPVVVGVDNAPPSGKNWEYTHYFPETGVSVPAGGVVLFQWNSHAQTNGVHSVTFVPTASTVAKERLARPTLTNDADNGETLPITPAITNNPTSATCSTGPTAPPCVFDGTSVMSSGIIPVSSGAAFAVQLAPTLAPGDYTYFCVIHPGMQGTIHVVPATQPATDAATLQTEATNERNQLNAGAAAAETAASAPTSTVNPDGSHTWTVHVGITADDVELLEYLPASVPIHKGDSVKFDASGTTQEIHTVTTGSGFVAGLVPFPAHNDCEVANGPDTPAASVNGPPESGCADPNGYEQPLNISQQGEPAVISSALTAASSFLSGRADVLALGGQASHTYKFPNNGTYQFFCAIHANMGGTVTTPGYRLGGSDGGVYGFGAADFAGSHPGTTRPVVAAPATLDNQGYWLVTADGHTYNFGSAPNVGNIGVHNGSPIVGAATSAGGLWLVAQDGRVYPLGGAPFMGDLAGVKLAAPIVGISVNFSSFGSGGGYDLVAADGGVFTFGSSGTPPISRFFGSMGGQHLNAPIVGMADTADGLGYYLVASDGGVFGFGSATFAGSMGGQHLNAPITGIAVTGNLYIGRGYTLSATDGGVFTFGDAPFLGSAAPYHPHGSIIGVSSA
jgi:plastocyanin